MAGRNLILVAGYPKSGSTWVRFVFEALRSGRTISINDMDGGYYGARRRMLFDELVPANAGDLLPEEIDDLLPDVFRALSRRAGGQQVVKVHDAAFRNRSGNWLIPPDCVCRVVYLTRHPFDVAASYAHHLGLTTGDAVGIMGRDEIIGRTAGRLRLPLHEHANSWSRNVVSWLEETPYDVVSARYEDLLSDPVAGFATLAAAAGLPAGNEAIAHACEAARFDRLRDAERDAGFLERPRSSPGFFRTGRQHSWQGVLDENLRARLIHDHGTVMARLGYASDGSAAPAPADRQPRAIA